MTNNKFEVRWSLDDEDSNTVSHTVDSYEEALVIFRTHWSTCELSHSFQKSYADKAQHWCHLVLIGLHREIDAGECECNAFCPENHELCNCTDECTCKILEID